jgi:8-oxo-dGTP pyrophosphatase MutT (NUDIX family)
MMIIYYHDSTIELCAQPLTGPQTWSFEANPTIFETLLEAIETAPEQAQHHRVWALGAAYDKMLQAFFALFLVIEAAGGLVYNEQGQILAILRRGFWDLPKGKVEKKEPIHKAALREVEEETGVKHLRLGDFLLETYHIYIDPRKQRRVLKRSHWYAMYCEGDAELVPQTEEDIELVCWLSKADFLAKKPIFANILAVLQKA